MGLLLFNSICNELGLPLIVRARALSLFKQCRDKALTRGRKSELMIAACIYLSCSELGYPYKLKDLCAACEESSSGLLRGVNFIKRFLEVNSSLQPDSYVSRYCYELGLSEADKTQALSNIDAVAKLLVNKSIQSVAAVCVYLTGSTSIRKLSFVSGLSNSHLHNCTRLVVNEFS